MRSDKPRFDGQIGNTYVEVLAGQGALRNLRAALMNMAHALAEAPDMRGLVVMDGARFSGDRFEAERGILWRVFRPEIAERIALSVFAEGRVQPIPHFLPLDLAEQLEELVRGEVALVQNKLPRPSYSYELFKILAAAWFRGEGPIAIKDLESRAGCTYPTVAKALEEMGDDLRRSSNRGVEFAEFPRQRWSSYLAQGDGVRQTFRFSDRSGEPRSAEALLRRFERIRPAPHQKPALGGVAGARGHFPGLDLLGLPRVDITLHCPDDRMDLGFVEKMDPGLKLCSGRDAVPSLVVHVLRRKEAGFGSDEIGAPLADPVECLLDLHEARLEPQAAEFFQHLIRDRLGKRL